MKKIKYSALRAELARHGITQMDFDKRLNLSPDYLCDKMNGKCPFKLDELRVIADEIECSSMSFSPPKPAIWRERE